MKSKLFYSLLILSSILTSCSSDEMEYIPFKSSENGGWGLINAKGKVKFGGEFQSEITAANQGVFFSKNDKGEWDLYSMKDRTPKPVSTGYAQAGAFIANVAPVVKDGERITLINSKGEVEVTLENAEGKAIEQCTNFFEGLARIYTADGWGVIDTSGDVIVKPKYEVITHCKDGMMMAQDKHNKIYFINKSGKVTGTIDPESIGLSSNEFQNNLIGARDYQSDKWGLLGTDGKWVLEPSGNIKEIRSIADRNIIFKNQDDKVGLMDKKGKITLQPSYGELAYVCGGDLMIGSYDSSRDIMLMDDKEKVYASGHIENGWISSLFPDVIFLDFSDHNFQMYSNRGKRIEPATRIYRIMDAEDMLGDQVIKSQYIDVDNLTKIIDIRENGIAGFTLEINPKTAITKLEETVDTWNRRWNYNEVADSAAVYTYIPDADDYRYRDSRSVSREIYFDKFESYVEIKVNYPSDIVDYDISYDYDYDYYYPNTRYTYYFKKIKPESIEVSVRCPSETVAKNMTTRLFDHIKTLGSVVGDTPTPLVVKTNDGYLSVYRSDSKKVKVILAKKALSQSDIEFDSVSTDTAVNDSIDW